jgi:hypothetical protein
VSIVQRVHKNSVPPQRELFSAAMKVLDHGRTPLHCRTLTERSLAALGYREDEHNVSKAAEDILLIGDLASPKTEAYGGGLRSFRASDYRTAGEHTGAGRGDSTHRRETSSLLRKSR